MRIDLVLAIPPVADRLTWGLVDRNARKGKLPSDHAPVLIEVEESRFDEAVKSATTTR